MYVEALRVNEDTIDGKSSPLYVGFGLKEL
jgi:hypothetical protein